MALSTYHSYTRSDIDLIDFIGICFKIIYCQTVLFLDTSIQRTMINYCIVNALNKKRLIF